MKPCQMAGTQCPHEATSTVRIDTVGDRPLCSDHAQFVVGQGFGRTLETNAYQPRWVGNLRAVDQTGRVLV